MTGSSSRLAASLLLLLLLALCSSPASARPILFGSNLGSGQGSLFHSVFNTNSGSTTTSTGGSVTTTGNTITATTGTTMTAQQLGRGQLLSFKAQLNGANQVPTPVQSGASATFTINIDNTNSVGYFTLVIRNVVNFTMAHVHKGNAATNGAPIVLLLPATAAPGAMPTPGVVATLPMTAPTDIGFAIYRGTITPASLITVDPATPAPTWAQFVQLLQTGNAYANIHTTAFPAGEIRGQYAPAGFTNNQYAA